MNKLIPTVLLAAAAALVACGGGSGMSSTNSAPGTTPVMATGTITGFGSIYVNGVHYQTTHATIRKNGQVVAQSALKVGEIARLKGTKNDSNGTGDADSVDVDESVVGPIATITGNTLTVLGQTVKVDTGTSFSSDVKGNDISGLNVKDFVAVSGLIAADGTITATRIDREASAGTLQVLGTVASVDTMHTTFKINALIVNYSPPANLTGFTSGQPADGDLVEVQGTMFDGTTLTATRVDKQMSDEEQAGNHEDMELEGLITAYTSATDFKVAGEPVTTTTSTVYRNGTAADLATPNVRVEVEGSLNSSNVLVADVVSFHRNGGVELQSTVDAVTVDAVDKMAGTLTVLGVQITVTSTTRLEDKTSTPVEMFSLSNINVGDTVNVHGFESPAGSGKLVATRLEREPKSMEVEVDGPFPAGVSGTSLQFTVFGITVDASSATLRGADGATLMLADFLKQAVGQYVEVTGQLSGMTVTVSEARIHAPGND
jgi:hypothetical protein